MNGPHDLGGAMGFGKVAPEPDEPVFHADWERRALALVNAVRATGALSIDAGRHDRESLHPADYYASSYYAIWTKALERGLVRLGFVAPDELTAGRPLREGTRPDRVLAPGEFAARLGRGADYARDAAGGAPAFAVGDAVRARVMHPKGHTRLPRYVRGKPARIEAVRGFHVFPDANAHGGGEAPQWLYTVVFAARDLWGPDADPGGSVSVDAWESYLEPA